MWRVWAKTIGNKISDDDKESDTGAIIRTAWIFLHAVTCIAIIANAAHQW